MSDPETQENFSYPAEIIRHELDLMTPDEFASAICVEPSTLETWRRKGEGPSYVKIGKQVFYRRCLVKDWLETRAQVASTEAA